MTSGPSDIPISTFEDVLHHKYEVVSASPFYEGILASSKSGSAKLEVYNNHFELKKDWYEAMNAVIQDSDSKTLYYANPSTLMPETAAEKVLTDKVFAIKMDDSVYGLGGLALQKDSEFLQIFNHYILKALEGGDFKRLYRNYFIDLYTNENFEMIEAQPLGLHNVMFCFTCIGFGICLSIIKAMMEFMIKRISKEHIPATTNE